MAMLRRGACGPVPDVAVLALLLLFGWLLLAYPGWSAERALVRKVAHLQARARILDSMYRAGLAKQARLPTAAPEQVKSAEPGPGPPGPGPPGPLCAPWPLAGAGLAGDGADPAATEDEDDELQTPTVFHFLPHLLRSSAALRPLLHSNPAGVLPRAAARRVARAPVTVALGVPVTRDPAQGDVDGVAEAARLVHTLAGLIDGVEQADRDDLIVLVLVAETNAAFVRAVAEAVGRRFGGELRSGLIELVSPRESFYPDELGAEADANPKHVLDVAFLMMYAQPRAEFYAHLADDVRAERGFVKDVKAAATALQGSWIAVEFAEPGVVGSVFQSVELPRIAQLLLMFYKSNKTVDALMEDYLTIAVCSDAMSEAECESAKDSVRLRDERPLLRRRHRPQTTKPAKRHSPDHPDITRN